MISECPSPSLCAVGNLRRSGGVRMTRRGSASRVRFGWTTFVQIRSSFRISGAKKVVHLAVASSTKKIVGDPIASNSFLPPRASSDAPARAYLLIFCSVNSTCLRTRGSYFMNSSFTGFFFGLRRFT